MIKATLVGVLVLARLAMAGESPTLEALYDQHRWFELHEAIKDREGPPLYKGAVAAAFNSGSRLLPPTCHSLPTRPPSSGRSMTSTVKKPARTATSAGR